VNWQTETILANIATFKKPDDAAATARLRQLRQHHAVAYINRFCWHSIDDSQRIVPAAAAAAEDNRQDLIVRMNQILIYC